MALERHHQQAVIKWTMQPSIRKEWPELALLYHIKNEISPGGGAAEVAADKANGVKKGVPDLHLPVPRGGYHSLYIEMKNETGRPSEAQKWWIEHLRMVGNYACVCRGWKDAVRVIQWYLKLPDRNDK